MTFTPHVHNEFTVRTTITFGIEEPHEPTAVTVEGAAFLSTGVLREFASEAMDSHFGTYEHGFRIHTVPLSREETDEDQQEVTFDVKRRKNFSPMDERLSPKLDEKS